MTEIALVIGLAILLIFVGRECYKAGMRRGLDVGSLVGIHDSLVFLSRKNWIGWDKPAQIIFRIKDDGGRGEAFDMQRKIDC